jgi:aminoglycoside 6'-N-acetyltransferase I
LKIIDLTRENTDTLQQAAALLVEGFAEHWPNSWPSMDSALEEVRDALNNDCICRIAVDDHREVLGWIGGTPTYEGNVWELHPLVVRPSDQGKGIGRALVNDLEELVRERGGLTIWLGSDDEDGMTSLAHTDLYPNPLEHLANIRNIKGLPYGFYEKMGFVLSGVLPDANGPGKPDIFLVKRVQHR